MDNLSMSRSYNPWMQKNRRTYDIKKLDSLPSTNMLNGKSHSSSTNITPHKHPNNSDKDPDFIMKIQEYPKKATVDLQPTWEKQFLEGFSRKQSIKVEELQQQKTLKSPGNLFQNSQSNINYLRCNSGEQENKIHHAQNINELDVSQNPFKQKSFHQNNYAPQSKIQVKLPQSSIYNSSNNELNNSMHQNYLPSEEGEKKEEKDPTTKSHSSEHLFKLPVQTNNEQKKGNQERQSYFDGFKLPNQEYPKQEHKIHLTQEVEGFHLPPTFKGTQKKDSYMDSSDDESNIFSQKINNKSNIKKTLHKTNMGYNMQILQQILIASGLYSQNYLKKIVGQRRSIRVYEAELEEVNKLPQEYFFKPEERIIFRKIKNDIPHEYNFNGNNMLCKVNQKRTRFFFQDLRQDQVRNLKGRKCKEISFPETLKISRNVEYDYQNKRFFIFSNYEQAIYVFSQTSLDLICSFKVKRKVQDPHLYLHQIGDRLFLLLIGGYTKIQSQIVQGSKFIQIFQVRKWQIQLKSRLVKLVIGRISPLVVPITQHNETKILIMGGNSIAKLDDNKNPNYQYQKEINESTNLTGVSLRYEEIIELFDYSCEAPALLTSHPINILNPLLLHDGCLIPIKNTFYMLLPKSKKLIQMKMFKKEIHLIQWKEYDYIPKMAVIQRRQLCINNNFEKGVEIYRITQEGYFSIIDRETENNSRCCLIY